MAALLAQLSGRALTTTDKLPVERQLAQNSSLPLNVEEREWGQINSISVAVLQKYIKILFFSIALRMIWGQLLENGMKTLGRNQKSFAGNFGSTRKVMPSTWRINGVNLTNSFRSEEL